MKNIETIKLTQKEMEIYLSQRDYDIVKTDDPSTIDSDKVIKEAEKRGFSAYRLTGDGKHADSFMFIKEMDYWKIKDTVKDDGPEQGQGQNELGEPIHFVWGRMGMSGYLTQKEVELLNNHPGTLLNFVKQGVFDFDGDTYFPDASEENGIINYLDIDL